MLLPEVVTYLEMTSPDQLRPGRPAPHPIEMRVQDRSSALVRATADRIAEPYNWQNLRWTSDQWARQLSRPRLHHWLMCVDGTTAGLLAVEAQPGGDAEIDMFGLVPAYVGKGYGGAALTQAVELAWKLEAFGAPVIRRIWLHTSSLDHPHALRNYEQRGFRVYQTRHGHREVPDQD